MIALTIRQICGDLCDTRRTGDAGGKYFPHLKKSVDCKALFEHYDVLDRKSEYAVPPKTIPKYLYDDFTYQVSFLYTSIRL